MGFTDQVSILIFVLVLLGVVIFVTMAHYVIGPIKKLRTPEKIILVSGFIGFILVVVYAGAELLFKVLF